ncbi:MAG TPA: energy transducer TonB [Gemmatirosa sp.]
MWLKLLESRRARVVTGWALMASITVHTSGIMATWVRDVMGGHQPPREGPISIRYLLPPDHIEHAVGERIQWVAPGTGTTGFVHGTGSAHVAASHGDDAPPPAATREVPALPGDVPDVTRIFSAEDVDTAVTRDPASDGPRYPVELREKGVQGEVLVEFTVDTAGHADTTTFTVVETSNPLFTSAVRDALPLMRFTPAVMHGRHVRQLVRLPMKFRLLIGDKMAT